MIKVTVHLIEQSQPLEYENVKNTYTKDGFYCVYITGELVHKFPALRIWRVIEEYGYSGREEQPVE